MPKMLFLDFSEKIVYDRINYAKSFHVSVKNTTVSLYLFIYAHTIKLLILFDVIIVTLCIHKLFLNFNFRMELDNDSETV